MTKGALIFAFDNEEIDYLSMAAWSAQRIHRHLDLPVCVVTDHDTVPTVFDRVVHVQRSESDCQRTFHDVANPVTWYNQDRTDAYNLSPWDHTLLLDADYVVAGNYLQSVMHSDRDFLCHRWAFDVTQTDHHQHSLNYFGRHQMPMSWATVIAFRKSNTARFIFDSMHMVKSHWRHYCDLYGVSRGPYRNDFALSIALGIVSGHATTADWIPSAMLNILPDQRLIQQSQDQFQVIWRDAHGRDRFVQMRDLDFHAMCKGQLGEIIANHG